MRERDAVESRSAASRFFPSPSSSWELELLGSGDPIEMVIKAVGPRSVKPSDPPHPSLSGLGYHHPLEEIMSGEAPLST